MVEHILSVDRLFKKKPEIIVLLPSIEIQYRQTFLFDLSILA